MGDAKFRTGETPGLCRYVALYECPLSIVGLALELASGHATVENFRPTRHRGEWLDLTMQLYAGDDVRMHSISAASLDVFMTREEFRHHLRFWDQEGVYAVFTQRDPLKFRASDLEPPGRYRALQNYGWSLELAIPGPSGGEWGTITSPDSWLIEQIVEAAARHYSAGPG